jgi:hypothetical protein
MTSPKSAVFYLVYQEKVIEFDGRIAIARKDGNVILQFDQVSGILQCSVEDKSKTKSGIVRDVTINNIEISYSMNLPLEVGEVLRVNGEEYKLFDNFNEAEKVIPKWNRRRNKRPRNAYAPINFVNFYCVPKWALGLYFCVLLFTLSKFIPGFHNEAPAHLNFLADAYNQRIITNSIQLIVLGWGLCLLHSFLMYLYFNRNAIRRFFISSVFIISSLLSIHLISRPLVEIHNYLKKRESLQDLKYHPLVKTINYRKSLIEYKSGLTNAFEEIASGLSMNNQKVLREDLESNIKKIDKELGK